VPAPQLKDLQLDRHDAAVIFERLIDDIRVMLAHNRIHGDLSPFQRTRSSRSRR
jgi:serine/threonine-protein kinase RIO1